MLAFKNVGLKEKQRKEALKEKEKRHLTEKGRAEQKRKKEALNRENKRKEALKQKRAEKEKTEG